jgi:hypothetical protein
LVVTEHLAGRADATGHVRVVDREKLGEPVAEFCCQGAAVTRGYVGETPPGGWLQLAVVVVSSD